MRLIISALVTLAVVLSIGSPTWAGYKEGLRAYRAKDYTTALHEFRPAADRGNARAQYRLGFMYEKGRGVSADTQTALKWYGLAAQKGHVRAMRSLSRVWRKMGTTEGYIEAHKWATLSLDKKPNEELAHWQGWLEKRLTYDEITEAKKRADEWRVSPATGILLAQDTRARAKCEFLPVSSVNCPASLSPQEAAFCGIWGAGKTGGDKLPICLAVEIGNGTTTIWYAWGEYAPWNIHRPGYNERKAQIKGDVMTASWPTRLPGGRIDLECRRDGDTLVLKYTRNNRTSVTVLPRFVK